MLRLEPFLHNLIIRKLKHHNPTVALSVATNMATTLLTMAIMMVEKNGGDIDSFLNIFMETTYANYQVKKKIDQDLQRPN